MLLKATLSMSTGIQLLREDGYLGRLNRLAEGLDFDMTRQKARGQLQLFLQVQRGPCFRYGVPAQ